MAPIGTNWGGSIGYDIEQRSINYGNPVLRQRLALNLRGKAITYISKPWIALVKGNGELTTYKSKTQDVSSTSNTIFGDIGLYLVPYSRYPFEAVLARTNNLYGPGFGSLVGQNTRLDLTQVYTPKNKMERYRLNAYRSLSEYANNNNFRLDGATFNIESSRLRKQTISLNGTRDNGTRLSDGSRYQYTNAELDHRYTPSTQFNLNTQGYMTSRYQQTPEVTDGFRIRELSSTFFLRPPARYYLIGTARIYENDYSNEFGNSRRRTANGNMAYHYTLSRNIYFYANANANANDIGTERRQTLTTTQSANANYPLANFNLGAYHYSSRISSSIRNVTRSTKVTSTSTQVEKGSNQSINLTPSQSLGRDFLLGKGKLNLGFSQSLSLNQSTQRSQTSSYFTNAATATWRHSQGGSHTDLRASFRDNRPLNSSRESFQYANFGGSISETINRDSSFTGAVDIQSTRQVNGMSPTSLSNTSSNLVLNYNHQRAFGVRRLLFNSNLNAYSRAPLPVLQASPVEQGPLTWENSLGYTIGRLITDFKLYMSKQGDGSTTNFIYFSVKRYF
jgi:hypothetical protein